MLSCRRFFTDQNFKNRIITNSFTLRNLKWSTKIEDIEERNNKIVIPKKSNFKRLTSCVTMRKVRNNEDENDEKEKDKISQKRETSYRARKKIISRLNNEIDLIGELKTNDKKEEISKIEINLNKENKYYIRKNSNKSMGYNDKLSEIYFNKNEINNVIKDNNYYINSNPNKGKGYISNISSYCSKNNYSEKSSNVIINNGGNKNKYMLCKNIKHIYQNNIIKLTALEENNSQLLNPNKNIEANNNFAHAKKIENVKIALDKENNNKIEEKSKIPIRNIRVIPMHNNSNKTILNCRNHTESNIKLKRNIYYKKSNTGINSDFSDEKYQCEKIKEIEINNDNDNNNNRNNLKKIKIIKNYKYENKCFSFYNYLTKKDIRNSYALNEKNKCSNISYKLDAKNHKLNFKNRFNNKTHIINLKALPNNKNFNNIEIEKNNVVQDKPKFNIKNFVINFFEILINISNSIDNRNNLAALLYNFNQKYYVIKNNNSYNNGYNIIFIDNENFEYVFKHFGLVLISLIFLSKDDTLYDASKIKVKDIFIKLIYSSLNYADMDNITESNIIYNFNKDNKFQSIISIHRYVLTLINLLFDNKKEYIPFKEALIQIYSIITKNDYKYILKIINESILFCYNSKSKPIYSFPFFNYNNNIKSLKFPKDSFNKNSNNNNPNTKIQINSNIKENVESIPFIKSPMKKKFCLVLDIDETISHTLKLSFGGYFLLRPGAKYFLEEVSKYYEIIIFTSSQKIYADKILDKIDINGNLFSYRLYKDHVLFENGKSVKNLNLIGRDLTKTIFIDNLRSNAKYNLDNLCPITTWKSDIFDNRLIKLKEKLSYIATCGKYDDDITQGL